MTVRGRIAVIVVGVLLTFMFVGMLAILYTVIYARVHV
jgi:hypothetical protein